MSLEFMVGGFVSSLGLWTVALLLAAAWAHAKRIFRG
jgi:hypothetical protein